jgi:hypothetical protein
MRNDGCQHCRGSELYRGYKFNEYTKQIELACPWCRRRNDYIEKGG